MPACHRLSNSRRSRRSRFGGTFRAAALAAAFLPLAGQATTVDLTSGIDRIGFGLLFPDFRISGDVPEQCDAVQVWHGEKG